MASSRTDAALVRLHTDLRKQAFQEAGAAFVRSAIEGETKTASLDIDWTLARKKHLETP